MKVMIMEIKRMIADIWPDNIAKLRDEICICLTMSFFPIRIV